MGLIEKRNPMDDKGGTEKTVPAAVGSRNLCFGFIVGKTYRF